MPRYSFRRNRTQSIPERGPSAFTIKDPSAHLAHSSPAALTPVSDFQPHQPKGHEWQKDAFAYNRLVGEVGGLHALTSEMVGSSDLRVVEDSIDPETQKIVTVVSNDPRAARVMRAFVGPIGGQKELKRRAALHYQIAGESILVATPLSDAAGQSEGFSWEFLSTQEIKTERKKVGNEMKTIVTRDSGYESDGPIKVDASVARWWRSDPEFSGRADSPMRRVLPICRELVVLSEVVDAIAKSRLNAGILLIPDELSFGPDDETSEEGNENGDIDKFMDDLMAHMSAPINDRTAGSSLVPLLLKAPSELIGSIKMLWLSRDLEETYQGLRKELLMRIAQGLDAPPEIMGGKASLNHWSAYSVDREFIDKHVVPIGEALAEFLTSSYLRRMLVKYEDMTAEEASRFRLVFDARNLAHRDDEAEVATAGWDRITISDRSWLISNGFTEGDMPDAEERRRRILEKMMLAAPGLYGTTLLPILYPELADSMGSVLQAQELERQQREAKGPAAPELADPTNGPRPEDLQGGPANGVPDAGPPTERPSGDAPTQRTSIEREILVERLVTAGDAALSRALERAGSRVLTRVNKNPELGERLGQTPKASIMSTMTASDFQSIQVDPMELISDALDAYSSDVAKWVEEWAVSTGASQDLASEVARTTSLRLCRHLDAILRGGVGGQIKTASNGLMVPSGLVNEVISSVVAQFSEIA